MTIFSEGGISLTQIYIAKTHSLSDPRRFQQMYESVPAHRREKIDKIRFEKDKRLCLGAWLLLAAGLRNMGIAPDTLTLSYGQGGKPYLREHPDIFFSLSHSGDRVMCAISEAEVGCDVEQVKVLNKKLAERFFTREEYEAIADLSSQEEQRQLFFRLWTLKESFMKVVGLGLALPLKDFSIDLSGREPRVTQQVNPDRPYYFREFSPEEGYRYACCAETPDFSPATILETL